MTQEPWAGSSPSEVFSKGAIDVLIERERHQTVEGFLDDHDDEYTEGDLAFAAGCYTFEAATATADRNGRGDCPVPGWAPEQWPWHSSWWKPAGTRRNLVKAAALLIAEIDRLDRLEAASHD